MSRKAHQEVDKFLENDTLADVQVCRVVVQKARNVSQEIAKQTGVRHESPQILLVQNGKCVWNASHRSITAENLRQTLSNK